MTETTVHESDASLSSCEKEGYGYSGMRWWLLATVGLSYGSGDLVEPILIHQISDSQETVHGAFQVTSRDLVEALIDLRARLETNAEPIEPDVKEVLYSNLWELYEG